MAPSHPPESREGEHASDVPWRDVPGAVAFALQREDRVGASLDPIVDGAGEVDAEKRQGRIRNRVDEMFHQRPALRGELVVLPPERNDADPRVHTTHSRYPISLQTGTVYEPSRPQLAARGLDEQVPGLAPHTGDTSAGPELSPPRPHPPGVSVGERALDRRSDRKSTRLNSSH